jgi:hypothetical protein
LSRRLKRRASQRHGRVCPGRRLIVVGAGTRATDEPDPPVGNGRAIAVLAARESAAVACVDANGEAAEATVAWIERERG